MTPEELGNRIPECELSFATSRSSGPGGQNVNKVNTKVEIRLNIKESLYFSLEEKNLILLKLKNRISVNGTLIVASQSERTQLQNRVKAISKLFSLLAAALTENPERRSSCPTKISNIKRIDEKRKRGIVKRIRKDPDIDGE